MQSNVAHCHWDFITFIQYIMAYKCLKSCLCFWTKLKYYSSPMSEHVWIWIIFSVTVLLFFIIYANRFSGPWDFITGFYIWGYVGKKPPSIFLMFPSRHCHSCFACTFLRKCPAALGQLKKIIFVAYIAHENFSMALKVVWTST